MDVDQPAPLDRFLSMLLLGAIIILWLSGIVMLYGAWLPWLYDLHRSTGYSLIVLISLKTAALSPSVLRRWGKTFRESLVLLNSLILITAIWLNIVLGIMWMWR